MKNERLNCRGSITLMQAVFVMTAGVVFLLAVAGFYRSVGSSGAHDRCAVELGFEFANSGFNAAADCAAFDGTVPTN